VLIQSFTGCAWLRLVEARLRAALMKHKNPHREQARYHISLTRTPASPRAG